MKDKFSNIWGDLSKKIELSTISDCSFGNDKLFIKSNIEAINFDKAKLVLMQEWFEEWKRKKMKPAEFTSVDCLYIQNGKLFLVEFKNTENINNKDVKVKIQDTLALLSRFYSIERDDFSHIEIILVRKFKSISSTDAKRSIREFPNKKANYVPRFSTHLDFLQKVYQTKISVLSPTDYEKLINTPNESEVSVST